MTYVERLEQLYLFPEQPFTNPQNHWFLEALAAFSTPNAPLVGDTPTPPCPLARHR